MSGKFDLSAAIAAQEATPMVRTIEDVTRDILRNKARAAQSFIEIGRSLIEAKELLPHGEWLPWLRDEVSFTERHAQAMMQMAREFPNTKTIAHLDMSKVQILLRLPAEERDPFLSTPHEVGGAEKLPEDMTVKELKAVVRERVEPPPPMEPEREERREGVLTKQDILAMTNMDKRKAFLDTWPQWPIWVDVPELGMTVRVIEFPGGERITATRFSAFCDGKYGYEHADLNLIRKGGGYNSGVSSTSELVEYLTTLRKEYAG